MAESLEMRGGKEKVTIVGRNLEITAAIKNHILTKIEKIEAHTPEVIDVAVYLEIQKMAHKAEILYKFSHFYIAVHATHTDLYQAFDLAAAKLKAKLRKWKTQIQEHHGKKISEIEMDISVINRQREILEEINDQIEEETLEEVEKALKPPQVVRKKKKTIPLLTTEEAAMRMDLSHDNFMVYRSEEDLKLKVMYVRRDHTLGILEIE